LGLISVQQLLLEAWNYQLVPYLLRYNTFPGLTSAPEITWANPGKVAVNPMVDAYAKGVTARLLTPIREDEEKIRALMDFPDLPEGEGEGDRNIERATAIGAELFP